MLPGGETARSSRQMSCKFSVCSTSSPSLNWSDVAEGKPLTTPPAWRKSKEGGSSPNPSDQCQVETFPLQKMASEPLRSQVNFFLKVKVAQL